MGRSTKANLTMTKDTVKVCLSGKMGKSIEDSGPMENNMGLEYIKI